MACYSWDAVNAGDGVPSSVSEHHQARRAFTDDAPGLRRGGQRCLFGLDHLETAKASNREPYAWLRFVVERLPMATTIDEIEALLPWNTHDQDLAMNLAALK